MKKQILKLSAMAALMAASASAMAVDITVNATVATPASATVTGSLNFGTITFVASPSGSAIITLPDAGGSLSSNANATVTGAANPATLNVSGTEGSPVTITWNGFNTNPPPIPSTASFAVNSGLSTSCTPLTGGNCNPISFGGKLTIQMGTTGAVSGTATVTVLNN